MPPAAELAHLLVDSLLEAAPGSAGKRVAPILNGLGTTKYEELFLLWGTVAKLLREAGLEVVDPEVGELVTSLDMGGISLTLMWLDEQLETFWTADTYTPAFRKQRAPIAAISGFAQDSSNELRQSETIPDATPAARGLAWKTVDALESMARILHAGEVRLGEIDAVAGDGDHGRGMVKGINAALAAARIAYEGGAGAGWLLQSAGQSWAERAGGTSGVLWGAALEAAGQSLTDRRTAYTDKDLVAAVRSFSTAILDLGRASIGDKTLVDAMLPFVEELSAGIERGTPFPVAWRAAAAVATQKAELTALLTPKLGRARPLAEKSLGTPDAGATSFALLVSGLADLPVNAVAAS
jgi:dihydroxyacetone kinase